jgi:hypothetical protein
VDSHPTNRILLVVSNLGMGGAEWQVAHLARGLAGLGHEVTIVALGRVRAPTGPLTSAGVSIVCLGATHPRARLARLPALTRLARRADIVHCTNRDASLYCRLAALAARRPVVVTDLCTDLGHGEAARALVEQLDGERASERPDALHRELAGSP